MYGMQEIHFYDGTVFKVLVFMDEHLALIRSWMELFEDDFDDISRKQFQIKNPAHLLEKNILIR